MKKIFTLSLIAILFCGIKANARFGALSGAYNIPGPQFGTLKAFIDTINFYGVAGPVTANLKQNEIAPVGGYVLGSGILNVGDSATSLARQLTITGLSGFPHTITANAGTGGTDAIFTIQGTDFVTITNLLLKDTSTNTTNTTMMERGFSVVKFATPAGNKDGVKTLSIKNCKVTLNNTNNTAATGVAPFGCAGIYIGNCLYGSTTALASSAFDTFSHDGIYLNLDTLQNVNHGIFAYGINVTIDGINNNDRGITAQTNLIQNFTHRGVSLQYFNNDQVLSNTINNISGGGTAPTGLSIFGVIYNNGTSVNNTNWTCQGNNINLTVADTITSSGGTYAATGIYSQLYGTGTTTISSDTVALASTGKSAQLVGIIGYNNSGTQTINTNVIQNFTTTATNVNHVVGIWTGQTGTSPYGYPKVSQITNNIIRNFTATTASSSVLMAGCIDQNISSTDPSVFTGNTITGFTATGTWSAVKGYQFRNNVTSGSVSLTVNSNTFSNINGVAAKTTPGLIIDPVANTTVTADISSNRFQNIAFATGALTGIQIDYGASMKCSKDTFINMIDSADVYAIKAGYTGYAVTSLQFDNNLIDSLSSNGTSAVVAGLGIAPGSGTFLTSTCNILNNTLRRYIATGTSALSYGLLVTGGTGSYNIYNNMISHMAAVNDTTAYSSTFGINLQSAGTNTVYYNTVRTNAGTSTVTGHGATGFLYNSAGTNTIKNNIFNVNNIAGTTNNVAAVRALAGTALSAPSISGFTASNNVYYAPVGPNNFLYVEGTTNASLANGYNVSGLTPSSTQNIVNDTFFNSTCNGSSYHKFMNAVVATREFGTFSENNLTGTSGSYVPTGISYAESGATPVSVGTDLAGVSRGSTPDIGALQFTGKMRPIFTLNVVSSTSLDTACTGNLPKLTAQIDTANFKHVSYRWYRDTTKLAVADTTKTILVSSTSAKYRVVAYDSVTGCADTSTPFVMTIMPPPPAFITYYDSLTFCQTSAVALHANSGSGYIYQWYKNGFPIPGETNPVYVASTTGTYNVQVNTVLGCPTMSTPIKVKVYPLPTPTVFLLAPRVLSTQKYYLYQWYKNNVLIPDMPGASSIGQNYLAPTDGAYTVEVTDSNGCTAKSKIYLFSLGIDNVQLAAAIKIYPNPTTGILKIESPVALNASLTDITGRVVFAPSEAKEIDLSNFAEGLYILSLTDKDGNLVKIEKVTKSK